MYVPQAVTPPTIANAATDLSNRVGGIGIRFAKSQIDAPLLAHINQYYVLLNQHQILCLAQKRQKFIIGVAKSIQSIVFGHLVEFTDQDLDI
ncbi:hypothetical protein [Methylobacterium mesophilicum]|uniref:hypothetical protein n=1 Tax=Methylobacterium mesophilicum TaxID=39956 RepID=UPI002F359E78